MFDDHSTVQLTSARLVVWKLLHSRYAIVEPTAMMRVQIYKGSVQ